MAIKKALQYIVIAVLAVIAVKFFFIPMGARPDFKKPFVVRVRVANDAKSLNVSVKGKTDILDRATEKYLERGLRIPEGTKITEGLSVINIGRKAYSADAVRISSHISGNLSLNGVRYRGTIDIVKTEAGLDAINTVELEDYLKGVLPREVNNLWPFAALEAQAIASRSFAVYKTLRRRSKEYDLTADTFSQVYGGRSAERWRSTRAVETTKNKVLEYDDKVFPAYFHACCGGRTEDASEIWGESPAPLKGVRCKWCRWSPYFRWRVRLSAKTVQENLEKKGYVLERVDDIRDGEKDESDRLKYVSIKAKNKWFEILIEDFRSAIGRNVLKSSNFRVKKYPFFYLFSGYGWGHGVGMCQWGAFGLAVRRKSAVWILGHYYPGAHIVDLNDVVRKF